MTYSPEHVTDDQRMTALLDALDRDIAELRQMLAIYGDAMESRGRGPEADPERTGRQATHDPQRPTEVLALDQSRDLMRAAVHNGVQRVARSVALILGTTAEMDRALLVWEGEDPMGIRGTVHGCVDGASEYGDAA